MREPKNACPLWLGRFCSLFTRSVLNKEPIYYYMGLMKGFSNNNNNKEPLNDGQPNSLKVIMAHEASL